MAILDITKHTVAEAKEIAEAQAKQLAEVQANEPVKRGRKAKETETDVNEEETTADA